MDEIVKILMRRDNITENEARNLIEGCRAEIQDALANNYLYSYYSIYDAVSDIIADWLGLEPDYLEYLL